MATLDATSTVSADTNLLRFITCGSVDDGKSTLLGRLLYDAGMCAENAKWLVLSGFVAVLVIKTALTSGCMDVQKKMPSNPCKALCGGGLDPPAGG